MVKATAPVEPHSPSGPAAIPFEQQSQSSDSSLRRLPSKGSNDAATKKNFSSASAFMSVATSNSMTQFNIKVAQLALKDDIADQRRRKRIAKILYHPILEASVGVITIFNFVVILLDTDFKAADEAVPMWIRISSLLCLVMYTVELAIRVFVERLKIFEIAWNWLDIFVVTTGIIGEVCDIVDVDLINLTFLRVLRCFRLLRIFKAMVLVRQMRELRKFVRGIISCLKTLLWGCVLVFLFMTMWSCLSVELLNPYMKKVYEQTPAWKECERCERSFTSIWSSNLTFFQTIVAGDSWGQVAIPVIEAYPWTAIIFMGSLFTLLVGILNLIVAVLVDTAAEARASDTAARALDSSYAERREKRHLEKVFRQIDADDSGAVTLDELEWGAEEVPEFAQILRVMDIKSEDLQQLFMILDEHGIGEINPHEFIEQLYRMKCGDHKTAATFAKHYVVHMKKNQRAMLEKLGSLESQVRSLKKQLKEPSECGSDYSHTTNRESTRESTRDRDSTRESTREGETFGKGDMDNSNTRNVMQSAKPKPKMEASSTKMVVPCTPKCEDVVTVQQQKLLTPINEEYQPALASARSGVSCHGGLRNLGISSRINRDGVSCSSGSGQIILSRDLREGEDQQVIALEHQFMQESLLCLLDEAEKGLTSALQQQIKTGFTVAEDEIFRSLPRDGNSSTHGNGVVGSHSESSANPQALHALFENIDQQVCTSLHQALQPIRNWRAIAEWVDGHKL